MNIYFHSKKLEKIFNDHLLLKKAFGSRANPIMRRMAVLAQAGNLQMVPTVPPERCHQLSGTKKGQFAVNIDSHWRLIFKPTDPVPLLSDRGVHLAAVTSICILCVEDYH